jgi:hypothetical protein
MDVDMVFRELAEPLAAGALDADVLDGVLAAADVVEDELLPHPATSATRAVAPAVPRPNFPIRKADIFYLESRWRPRTSASMQSTFVGGPRFKCAARNPANCHFGRVWADRGGDGACVLRLRRRRRQLLVIAGRARRDGSVESEPIDSPIRDKRCAAKNAGRR